MNSKSSFRENDSVKNLYKDSLFKSLFTERKDLLEGYPGVGKGLQLSDPSIRVGANTTYTWTNNTDKITWQSPFPNGDKFGVKEIIAAHKKGSPGRFDLTMKQKVADDIDGFVKYEERGNVAPDYVVGATFNNVANLQAMAKYNTSSGFLKLSALYNANDILAGTKLACDVKAHASGVPPQFNVGASYKSPMGLSGLAYNDRGQITVCHHMEVDKNLSAYGEYVHTATGGASPTPFTVGVGYQIDNDHFVKARLNKAGELNVSLKKTLNQNFALNCGAVLDLTKPDLSAPAVGFKLETKQWA